MNRFQSIVDGIAASTLADLRELHEQVSDGHWLVRKGKLYVRLPKTKEEVEFEFDASDPDTQALLAVLNNMKYILSALGAKR